jgi:hypothetical protein
VGGGGDSAHHVSSDGIVVFVLPPPPRPSPVAPRSKLHVCPLKVYTPRAHLVWDVYWGDVLPLCARAVTLAEALRDALDDIARSRERSRLALLERHLDLELERRYDSQPLI